jgi:hypothetical protein
VQTRRCILFCLLLLPLLSHAQYIYICKDASGRTIGSDRPIRECADRPVRELDTSGMVRREIAAPLTPEQKHQKQLDDDKRRAEEAAEAARKQEDRALLARYRNEADITSARKRLVEVVEEHVKRETAVLALAENQRKTADAELQRHKGNKDVPVHLQRKIEASDAAIRDQKKKLRDYDAEIGQIDAKFDATLKRFRELSTPAAVK